ncbi:MAG TPA: GIY-YIG nuclease family protein [Terracidiphilus sp.]|nr:GIY-YIG nuclease family protein [Terracidiphilus sp.]
MQSKGSRREAIRQFKEQKPLIGAYSVRCTATGSICVGVTRNLEATKNRCWFSLRNGMFPDKLLQQEWNLHGESAFRYEMLDSLDEETHPLEVDNLLKEMKGRWVAQCGARPLL